MCNMKRNSNSTCGVCAYYDIRQKKFMWINRVNPNFEQPEIPMVIDRTGHAERIRARLQQMNG